MNVVRLMYILIILSTPVINLENKNWINRFSKLISKQVHPYQVIVVLNHPNYLKFQNIIDNIFLSIGQKTPLYAKDFKNLTEQSIQKLKKLSALENPRQTTLFVLIKETEYDEEISHIKSKLTDIMSYITRISGARMRPKCLIFHLTSNKTYSYANLLREMWSKKFLDLSILEIIMEKSSNLLAPYKGRKMSTLHFLNPFTGAYNKNKFSLKTELFPNKLLDLRGHEMKVGFYHFPPYSFILRNLTDNSVKLKGRFTKLTELLSQKMSFKIKLSLKKEMFGKYDYNTEKMTGLLYQLTHNQIEFISIQSVMFDSRELGIMERTIFTNYAEYNVLVPILKIGTGLWRVKTNFITAAISIVCLLIITWITARSLKFNIRFWRSEHIVQLVLGSPVPEVPQKLRERIVFACIFLACIVYSSWIYQELTNILLKTQDEVKFDTIEDLMHSNLTRTMSDEATYALLKNTEDSTILKFLNNSVLLPTSKCIQMLVHNRNVSCIVFKELIDFNDRKYRSKRDQPLMKLVGQILHKAPSALKLKPGSPYAERFNHLILRLFVAGIFRKWYDNRNFIVSHENQHEEEVVLQWQLLFIPLVGYGISVFAFITEIITRRFEH